jgi:hypothetical protein
LLNFGVVELEEILEPSEELSGRRAGHESRGASGEKE